APGANSEPQTLVEIDREADNVRAAWEHLVSERRTTEAAALLNAHWRYLDRRARHQEIASVLQRALQLPAISRLQRARWLRWLGEAHYQMGSVEEAREHLIGAIQVVDQRSVPDTGRFQLGLARTIARQAALRLLPPLRRRAAPDEQAL